MGPLANSKDCESTFSAKSASDFSNLCLKPEFNNGESMSKMPSIDRNKQHIIFDQSYEKPIFLRLGDAFGHELKLLIEPSVKIKLVLALEDSKVFQANNIVIELLENAQLELYELFTHNQVINPVVSNARIELQKNAQVKHFLLNSKSLEKKLEIKLKNEEAAYEFYLLDQLIETSRSDIKLSIHHESQNTHSKQSTRGIYGNQAQGNFLGKVLVYPGAAKSSAEQQCKTLLLSPKAKAQVLPQLEIDNFDIKASHGATMGELDQDALFYLQSRGLSLAEAKALLVEAFARQIYDHIALPSVQNETQKNSLALLKNLLEDGHGLEH